MDDSLAPSYSVGMPLRLSPFLPFLSLAVLALHAQQPLKSGPKPTGTTSSALAPANMSPEKLLAFATTHNGIGEIPGDGWHLRATFEVSTGKFTGKFISGTYEETWYAPQNYRRTYSFRGVSHTDVATPDGLFRSGDQAWPSADEIRVRTLLVHPIASDPPSPKSILLVKDLSIGDVLIPCLYEVSNSEITGVSKKEADAATAASPHLCFDPTAPILRLEAGVHGRDIVRYSKIKIIRNHILAQEIEVLADRVRNEGSAPEADPTLRIHVELAEPAPPAVAPSSPIAGATKLQPPFNVPFDLLERIPGGVREPIYPAGAIQEKLEDTIHIAAVVSPTGDVSSANVLNGMLMLRESALEYVKQLKFKPFSVGGVPVEVHTEIPVDFDLRMAQRQRSQ